MHSKFQPYLDRFIYGSFINSLQGSIIKRDLETTHYKAILYATQRKVTEKVVQ